MFGSCIWISLGPYPDKKCKFFKQIKVNPHLCGFLSAEWWVDLNMQSNMELIFRKSKEGDIPSIVKMLADDELGSKREDYKVPLPKSYTDAFQNILQDKNQELIILEILIKK